MRIAQEELVAVLPLAGGGRLTEPLTYRWPLRGEASGLAVGQLVRVPLRNRHELGIVTAVGVELEIGLSPARLKLVAERVYEVPVVTPDLLALARWVAGYYACPLDGVLEAMIPGPVRSGMRPKEVVFLEKGSVTPLPEVVEKLAGRAPQQVKLWRFLAQQAGPVPKGVVLKRLGVGAASCRSLVEKGWVAERAHREQRDAYLDELASGETVASEAPPLTEEQLAVAARMDAALAAGGFGVRLLHGVTGSGKTEIYLRAAEQVLARGGGVLFLVPEVALAPQTVARLRGRLTARGYETVVWHSFLSEGERFDAWQAAAEGRARVVVGARSAVFAPIPRLELIVVDEEHEPAYKQEETPRYHGRDVAVYRAKLCGALCVLGSATPSLESLVNARQGKYALDRITRRVDHRDLPTVHLVDMRLEFLRKAETGKGGVVLSRMLAEKMRERFERREQTILFLNRRGFATSLLCMRCGWVAQSPNSSVSMTYHQEGDKLKCHWSGHEERAPARCPQCGSDGLRKRGIGTQRVEAIVAAVLPRARVVRMDADAMSRKNLFRKILDDFRTGKIDVLVGTQMIAKGLDFPNVTLVGLIDADLSLHLADFRAAERTFQLVVQVSGRAGRGEGHGEVVVQTYLPSSEPLQYARRQDFDGFLDLELEQRREWHYPPYRHLIRHLFRGPNPEKVAFFAEQFAKRAEADLGSLAEIRGPAPAPMEKVQDHYRFHIWYFCPRVMTAVARLEALRREFPRDKEVVEVLDVDPVHLG